MQELSQEMFFLKCKNDLFCSPENPLHKIGNLKNRKFLVFQPNEFLFKEGQPATGIFCITYGAVEIRKAEELYSKLSIHCNTHGEIIGFNSIVDGKYILSAAAAEKTYACFIPLSEINQLIKVLSTATQSILCSKW